VTLDADTIAAMNTIVDGKLMRAGMSQVTAIGVITSIVDVNNAYATFEGSSASVPVSLAGSALIYEGDRVTLVKCGQRPARERWVAVCALTRRWQPHSGDSQLQTVGTTVSSSYSDTPVLTSCTFVKHWDATRVYVAVTGAAYSTVTNTVAVWGANFNDPNQATIPSYDTTTILYNTASEHLSVTNWRYITDLLAGTYTVKVRWKRTSGTGTVSADTNDRVSINVMEISPT